MLANCEWKEQDQNQKVYKVIHFRYLKGSDQNGPFIAMSGISRKKEARGQLKQLFRSQIEVMAIHEELGDDFIIMPDSFLILGIDWDNNTQFLHHFWMEEEQ